MQIASVVVFAVIWELLALSALDRCPIIQVTAQSGFVSIDCGGNNTNYKNSETNISWTSDSTGFGLEKVSSAMTVRPPANNYPWLSSVRVFEGTQSKYCYVFNASYGITVNKSYLVRASFWTGDSLPFSTPNKEQISFQLVMNADVWDDIVISLPQKNPLVKEVYVIAENARMSVCVTRSVDPAFISSLELRPIDNRWDVIEYFMRPQNNTTTAPKLMFLYARLDLGSSTGKDIRYPDDPYDRIWTADVSTVTNIPINISGYGGPTLSTSRNIPTPFYVDPPSAVLQTALIQNTSLNITFDGFSRSYDFFYYFFSAEISDDVTLSGERVFGEYTITVSGVQVSDQNIDPYGYNGYHVVGRYYTRLIPVTAGGFLTLSFERNSTSRYGPLVSALELQYASEDPMSSETDQDEVATLEHIKTSLQGFDSWRGDPCLPVPYEWLTCDSKIPPHIITLSLQNRNITADIPVEIGNLRALVEIDLHGNNLHGVIPDSLAQLPNLKTLLLQDNNLSGPIPPALLEKNLLLSVAGNPNLCTDNNASYCEEQPQQKKSNGDSKSHLVAILVSISVAVVLLVLASIFIFYFRRKGKTDHVIAITREEVIKYSNLAQEFTYQQIERITNGFKTKLGAGGFGDVFSGTLSTGLNVAVKVSSQRNGAEGLEFLNEVALLSRVHHKNLVEFVGYCIHPRLTLVYEYMEKGSLDNYLHGNFMVPLSWRARLKIVVGAAQGLEYLHKGCKPPIIHRDVKCSNILLDEELEGRISDFGISRSKSANTHMTVTNVQGTVGYMAPEYAELRITEKIDVFAFGVVLLEVVSGRRAFEGSQHIVNWVRPLLNQSRIDKIVDPSIVAADYSMSSMWKLLEVAMACVEHDIERRPDMHEVTSELNSALSFELQNEADMISCDATDLPFDSVNVLAR